MTKRKTSPKVEPLPSPRHTTKPWPRVRELADAAAKALAKFRGCTIVGQLTLCPGEGGPRHRVYRCALKRDGEYLMYIQLCRVRGGGWEPVAAGHFPGGGSNFFEPDADNVNGFYVTN